MTSEVLAKLNDYIIKFSYPHILSGARVDIIQEYCNFVNELHRIKYLYNYERSQYIQIARNIAGFYKISDYIDYAAFRSADY